MQVQNIHTLPFDAEISCANRNMLQFAIALITLICPILIDCWKTRADQIRIPIKTALVVVSTKLDATAQKLCEFRTE